MHEAVFRVESDGLCAQATRGTDARIELWCNDHCDLLSVAGRDAPAVVDKIEREIGLRERVEGTNEVVAITDTCLTRFLDEYVESYLARHDCLLVAPLTYEDGAKHARILALEADALTDFYRDLAGDHTIDVTSKREHTTATPEGPTASLDAVLPTLSPRQREVFTTAHAQGYYDIPRGVTTKEIAKQVGIERRTADHHLRRAEAKLADAIVDYV